MNAPEYLQTAELISWIDVARRLSYVGELDAPPSGVLSSSAYWSGLTIRTLESCPSADVESWLSQVFGTWLVKDGLRLFIRLEAPSDMERLPISIVHSEASASVFRPHAALEGERHFRSQFPDRGNEVAPPVVAFHSVKGGVGRTTSAIAFAAERARSGQSVLLIDADFEAPGVSFLVKSRKPNPTISFEDLLALAHADRTDDFSASLDFIARRMLDQQVDGVFVLPAKRILDDLSGFAIRPENLLTARRDNPYVVVDLVKGLARKLNCKLAVVDLRAGLVDVSVQFLSDPTVERVFVSTAGGQSLSALRSMIRTLGIIEQQTKTSGRQPLVLFNQLPIYRISDAEFRAELIQYILPAAEKSLLSAMPVDVDGEGPLSFGFLPHLADLIATAGEWDAFQRELIATNFSRLIGAEMRPWAGLDRLSSDPGPATQAEPSNLEDHNTKCRRLQEFAEKLEVAETAENISQPLATPPVQRLASDFLSQPPIVIVEGAKGTGKTLTARYFLERENWKAAVQQLDSTLNAAFEGPFLPLFGSVVSSEAMLALVRGARGRVTDLLKAASPAASLSETEQNLKGRLANAASTGSWLEFWLEQIAASAGYRGLDAWAHFVAAARASELKPIVIVEGLEEVLTDPFSDPAQAAALLSLLREVPLRLREEAGRPVGYVAFVRADMVETTMVQNLAQFRAGYANYALTWRDVDIKELVVWLVSNSGAMPGLWSSDWRKDYTEDDHESDLRKVWGLKLGHDDSREARSTEWVIAVLTDLTGRLTARDLVRFMGSAAKGSRGQPSGDRLLSASALKTAVEHTSRMKVEEYPKEVRQLDTIFEKFKKNPGFETPFVRAKAAQIGVTENELDILEKYGVAYQEDGVFEVPELFRVGLEMRRGGARPNIISLTRRARERARA